MGLEQSKWTHLETHKDKKWAWRRESRLAQKVKLREVAQKDRIGRKEYRLTEIQSLYHRKESDYLIQNFKATSGIS